MLLEQPWIACIALMIVSYFIGGIPFGVLLGKLFGAGDIRSAGSGNIGTTNALRVAGPVVAVLTLIGDLVKGSLCIICARWLLTLLPVSSHDVHIMLAAVALATLFGHIFSPYLGFRGGKGIATGVGILFGFWWPLALIHLGIFAVLVLVSRFVSLGSIVTAVCLPLSLSIFFPDMPLEARAIWILLSVSVVWAHRSNIVRLSQHREARIGVHSFTDKGAKS
ncbi:glycerol-3-phosphate 1-O-acyltransferase PlsY [Collinsella sp. zg1085]|nr:glycerol-3-phosphate 1-O-acyltransferase PlsY [Collinsella sp. zg1085]